jgi:hypothetical protein
MHCDIGFISACILLLSISRSLILALISNIGSSDRMHVGFVSAFLSRRFPLRLFLFVCWRHKDTILLL